MENKDAQIFKLRVMPLLPVLEGSARRWIRDEDDVRDVLQETLLRLWRYRDRLEAADNVSAYCLNVARNVAFDFAKSRSNLQYLENLPELTVSESADDEVEEVERAMQCLSQNQQDAIRLRGFAGMEVEEIAENMNISEANVRQLLSRGRRRLRELLLLKKYNHS